MVHLSIDHSGFQNVSREYQTHCSQGTYDLISKGTNPRLFT